MSDIRQYVTSTLAKCVTVTNLVCSDVDVSSKQIKNFEHNTFVIVLLEFNVIQGYNLIR